jgi:glycosyltransferase involved in cell wall biosynthesis
VRILQFIDIPWDSGLAHYALALSQGLQHKGHEVFISALPGQKPWLKAQRLGLKTVPLATIRRLNPLRRFLKDQGVQILDAHTGSTHSLAVAASLGQKIAVVRTRADARSVRRRVGSKFLYNHTHRVIAAADYIRDGFVKTLRVPESKVVTIYQGLDVQNFQVKTFPDTPVLGIMARLDPVKGHRYLLEAAAILRRIFGDFRIRIMGQEENVKQSDLRDDAWRLRVHHMVEFLGFQKDVQAAMAECSIGVIASTGSEAVSRVALEWMASGRPVVATRVGCLPEIVEDGQTGILVEPKDAPDLASALSRFFNNGKLIESMGEKGRARVEKYFNLPDFVSKTESVYEQAWREIR